MLTYEFFDVLAFPYRVQETISGKLLVEGQQTLFSAPKYKSTNEHFFSEIKGSGWRRCPDGYAAFACVIPSAPHAMLILHGLKVNGFTTIQGRSAGLSIKLDRADVEDYVKRFLSGISQANLHFGAVLSESIHELRGINAALYHSAYELQSSREIFGMNEKLAKNVTSLSELISERMNLIDFLATQSQDIRAIPDEDIAVFRKFDKLVRCFIAFAGRRDIYIKLGGQSHGFTKGNSLFELIPLLLLDNAVKYSPNSQAISVVLDEDVEYITCSIKSVGPKVADDERSHIFDQSFRGAFAKKAGKSGSGIGLFFLKNLIETFGGDISFNQDELELFIDKDVPYHDTEFFLRFPRIR